MCQQKHSSITTSLTHYGSYRIVVLFDLLTQNTINIYIWLTGRVDTTGTSGTAGISGTAGTSSTAGIAGY